MSVVNAESDDKTESDDGSKQENRRSLHRAAFGLYSVIVGLAIKEGLTRALPAIMQAPNTTRVMVQWQVAVEVLRLITFTIVTVRFYLGASEYFDKVYLAKPVDCKRSNYGIDYIFGLVHFVMFFFWSATIDRLQGPHAGSTSDFLLVGAVILLYDVPWFLVNCMNDSIKYVKLWTVINLGTVIVSFAVFMALRLAGIDPVACEEFSFLPVIAVSILDLATIFSGNPYAEDGIKSLLSGNR